MHHSATTILLVEDNPDDVTLTEMALRKGVPAHIEVARDGRQDERTRLTPVVILTSSDAPDDIIAGYHRGANSYLRKPVDFEEFVGLVHQLGAYWLGSNQWLPGDGRP